MIEINYLAVVAAAVLNMVIGFLWYGPVFGKKWMALSGITPGANSKGMGGTYLLALLSSLVMAYVLAHSIIFASAYLNISGLSAGLQGGFWNWLGLVAPVLLGTVLWEGKSWKLWTLNSGYYLVSLCAMGVVLAMWA